ncbi:MAG: alpha/beta hydrolase [Nevskia sp.]|nr:alpha/beta hydrolase [Nevskia sp.]
MSADGFQFDMPDGRPLYVHRWLSPQSARSTLLVVHGMAEHGARYARLADALNAAGWDVYAMDWPGHGRSVNSAAELGHVADRDGWGYALDALHQVRQRVAQERGAGGLFVLGHSMGSFLVQHYIAAHGAGLAGVVLSATSGSMGPLRAVGTALMRLEALLLGVRHRSALAEALSFKSFNRKFAPARTPADWLSRDPYEVDQYVADPLCGFRCSAGLWGDLLTAGAVLCDPQHLAGLPAALPILLLSGGEDPVTQGGRGTQLLLRAYRAAGLKDVTLKIYDGARHELLNEIESCRAQVTEDLLGWLGHHRG